MHKTIQKRGVVFMQARKKTIAAISIATLWVAFSEFFRNQIVLSSHWKAQYANMGLVFPSEPANGAVWGIWSLCFAALVYIIPRKFTVLQTVGITWVSAFAMMWLVIGNMAVLPVSILGFAIPLSLLESFVATLIVTKLSPVH
jgi:hypothetical protein